ncbi:MAG TPA: hypothetical protein VFX51_29045 [Solirubrobacteraceae bacterium]|nr:hypothetical protein [Solirubrobacteraceae bacterium]
MRSLVLAALALAAMPAVAQAQDTDVGGSVPSMLELSLSDVSLGRLPSSGDLTARVRVTSTTNRTALSAVDEDLGRSPIEARIGSTAFQPLDLSIDPLLAVFRRPVSNERATIRLRRRSGARVPSSTTVLITVSPDGP